ncbi:bacteriohemerythrin [Natroniella sulfidigena]|uniref:bacteriohemerythrin n=1 Tax=Natroniella sulfidigena TaxID=723921 RepID=UPI00200A0B8A|nr:bacteriohemerythrin [Natroniella sulfidigena]MCK8818034.1 bacteriohemerythrin [Natroniella sulfidigena]
MLWKEQYKIGIDQVDQQHKELFNRLNSFLTIVRNDEPIENKIEEIEKTLDFMGEYVVVHFDSEEKVQQEYNYPDYEEHKEVHERFKAEILKFKEEFEADKCNEDLIMEFSGKLLTWLINHVADEDQRIADYVQN